ncbi:hypothetical protein JG688_00010897 [Phytophthora aleatoria]|uniref:Uncharacterized protein n=1 Tax=Phytophthora aleatoria TaxID=2496075 RepID=A0A8J5IHP1_9STRA|nr:hypothetical protein JG688_00010897 [Phytophthora aleatoria]
MALTNRIICSLLFWPTGPGKFACNSRDREYRSLHGFTNLMNHLLRFHPSYEANAEAAAHANNALRLHVVDARTTEIYRWVEWVVVDRLPFTFVERRLVHQNARMGNITAKTLTIYVKKLLGAVDQRVIKILPKKFGLVLDGLTCGGRHYVGIFAVIDDGTRVAVTDDTST